MRRTAAAMIFGAALLAADARAAELRVGLLAGATSVDPQFYVLGPNSSLARNIFDGLVNQDERQQIVPALAVSWTLENDTTWLFKLRPNVAFHDGTILSAADVVASLARVELASRNSPSSFQPYVRDIQSATAVDPLTVRIVTKTPTPLLLNNLSRIAVLPAASGGLSTGDLNGGKGVIGTGPFKLTSWLSDDSYVLARHDAHWGDRPGWDSVQFKVQKVGSARVAALLAGDVDMIEAVPAADLERIGADKRFALSCAPSNRVMYLHLDHARETSPFAAGADGRNPLRDARVRRALSLAINRKALVERIMSGQGEPAGQLVPKGYFGWSPKIETDAFDPEAARKLLAAAGVSSGFKLTLHASSDRYPNDALVAQALGQMFSRIGVETSVDTMPGSIFFTRASKLEFSLIMGGAAVETGEASGVLAPLLATFGTGQGLGNRGRYSSAAFDAALKTAQTTIDAPRREAALQEAMDIGMRDLGVIPIFFIANCWAAKASLAHTARSDGYTLASGVRGP